MKKRLVCIVIFYIMVSINLNVFAISIKDNNNYTEDYKKYIEASDKEKSEYTVIPNQYKISNNIKINTNPIRMMNLIGASNESSYCLTEDIPNSIIVKDQKNLNLCWGFATLSSLATNLALKNKTARYDFSVRHMDYASIKDTSDGVNTNPYGLNRTPGTMATPATAINYLTNGLGAVKESDMPLNYSTNLISLNDIFSKEPVTEVYDIKFYPEPATVTARNNTITEVKKNIKLHGAVSAQMVGANLTNNEYYNSSTGAIYYPTRITPDHAAAIIGWDDNYDVSNFNSNHVPPDKGAWIIQNSWGTNVGNNGLMYISYYDANIYKGLMQITNAVDKTDSSYKIKYNTVYMYDQQGFGPSKIVEGEKKVFFGDIYKINNNNANESKYLSMISFVTLDPCTCKVYVNPNGASLDKDDLVPVTLKSGEQSEDLEPGFHTLEFETPTQITSPSGLFAVVLEVNDTSSSEGTSFYVETNQSTDSIYSNVEVSGQTYITSEHNFENNEWDNLKEATECDITLRAYTFDTLAPQSELTSISITTQPTKTVYKVGDNFSSNGMVVVANYKNGETQPITDYTILNGTSLKKGQTSVTISYKGKTITQPITVNSPIEPVNEVENTTSEDENKVAQNSIMSNLNCTVTKVNSNSVKIKINNFSQNKNNDLMEYSYYVSNSKEENTSKISFIKMNNAIITGNSIEFDITSDSLENLSDLDLASKTYLYIREIAKNGADTKVSTSNAMELNLQSSTQISQDRTNTISSDPQYSLEDDTVAKDPIPQTGVKPVITIIVFIGITGIIMFTRYLILQRTYKGK